MMKRFIVLAFCFGGGMALGLTAANLLALSLRTLSAAPVEVPDDAAPLPACMDDPLGIEASHDFGFLKLA